MVDLDAAWVSHKRLGCLVAGLLGMKLGAIWASPRAVAAAAASMTATVAMILA